MIGILPGLRCLHQTRGGSEFREGAVRIVKETGKPVAQVARDLGISPYTLHNWVKLAREADDRSGALGESERAELVRLREHKTAWEKERAELEMERDVLKRSVVLWVKNSMNR